MNYRPQLLTLMRKLTVLSLFVLLVLLGLAGYFIFPVLQEEYKAPPPISAMERIRFTPNLQGGYDVAQIAYQFDDDLGVGVPAEPSSEEPATLDLIFPFRFYESVWENANIYAHGLITFGEPSISVPFVEHRHPAIAPWMARLAADSGKVFINQKREQITITWQHVADLTIGEPNTFQVVLYPNGAIDFVYQELQSTLHFGSEMTDGLWLVGLLPGNGTLINQWIHYKRDLPYAGQRGQALVENVYLGFRRHVDQVLRPLAMLTIISALIILIGFPLCFRVFLIRPLNALTTGVRAVNQGDLQVRIPHYFDDELGFLTQSFNGMVDSVRSSREQLQQLNVGLEQRVAERTEQLALARDAAEEANRAKSSFLANMSHELRTPLNAILGYAQLLQNRATSQETRGAGLDTIYESGQHLLALIDNVLDLAKIEAGKVDYQPARLYLPALLQSISKIVQYQAQAKSLVYTYAADADLPDYIVGDERLLRQVLLNLLGNAIKFTHDGRVTLIVQRLTTGAGQALRFSVKDEGVGIAPEQLAKIFLPFEQAHVAQSRASGTGLGLTISQQLLTIMESRLYVKSTVGHGSTFWFDLALVEPPAATIPAGPTLRAPIIGYDGPRQQVLVADDNPANRQVLHDMLAIVGFEVLLANDGLQAHEAALAHQPCLILMDLVMPGMNGIEASAAIRKAQAQRTETSAAPPRPVIIAVSASALASEQERSLAAGCDAFLTKPIDWRQLSDLLARHLDLPWRYAAVDSQPLSTPAEASTLPPSAIIEKLYSAARMGEMSQIVKLAGDLAHTGFGDTAFVAELTALAGNYQEKAVLNLVETRLLHLKTEE
ncbi:MAG: ATP-binding protein [Caldilineaceae bacterium]